MSSEHIGDFAELYALGALEPLERRRVDEHVRECRVCAGLLAIAESTVALAAAAEPQHQPPERLRRRLQASVRARPRVLPAFAAIAAALIVGLLPSAYLWQENHAMHAAMLADAAAIDRLASEPHRSAAFTQMGNGSAASVMYAPNGSWYVVLVRGASHAVSVAWMHDGQKIMLGTAVPHGDVAMLYLPKSHRMDQLALMDGDTVVAEAQLAY
jgi:hypothetical protein